MSKVQKAIAISDAKISFISLVNKAANKKQFLITKAENGKANFSTYGRIVKTDADNHFVTGIVYEPMVEDAHGNFMTAEEITKAAYWFAKNGSGIDLQHDFQPLEKAEVVENWVAKADFEINGETVKKGTWLMTVEVTDEAVWDAVQKGEITGFSMGGVGIYDTEDTDLEDLEKSETPEANTESKGFFKKLAKMFGFDVVEKGAMADEYQRRTRYSNFWEAFYTLEDILCRWDYYNEMYMLESDEEAIRSALADFSAILTDILTDTGGIAKALSAGRPAMSDGMKTSLTNIQKNIGAMISASEQEETDMNRKDVEKIVEEAIAKALNPEETPATEETPKAEAAVTVEDVQKMVEAAVAKATAPQPETVTPENINDIVEKAVAKAIAPVLKARSLPSALDNEPGEVKKETAEPHYLAGIL